MKAYGQWSSVFHDDWNVPGILGGIINGANGQSYVTSHYGFYMSSWHIVMGVSGQRANMTEKSLTFTPRLNPPYSLPVILPTVWGHLRANINHDASVTYVVKLEFGRLELSYLAILDCKYPNSSIVVESSDSVTWSCPP